MAYLNEVYLIGRLVRDPELSYTPSQKPIAKDSIAVSKKKKQPDGTWIDEKVDFFDFLIVGEPARIFAENFHKGNLVLLQGSLRYRRWDDQQGNKHKVIDIISTTFVQKLDKDKDAQQIIPDEADETSEF